MRIVCKNLTFSYSPKKRGQSINAVDNLSLTINEGEFFGIIGHTGSGKSTFIQHLNALIPLQEGQLFIGDMDLNPSDKDYKKRLKELRQRVGMVFQYPEYQLFAESVFVFSFAFALASASANLTTTICFTISIIVLSSTSASA